MMMACLVSHAHIHAAHPIKVGLLDFSSVRIAVLGHRCGNVWNVVRDDGPTSDVLVCVVLGDLHLIRRLVQRAALQQSDRGSGAFDPRARWGEVQVYVVSAESTKSAVAWSLNVTLWNMQMCAWCQTSDVFNHRLPHFHSHAGDFAGIVALINVNDGKDNEIAALQSCCYCSLFVVNCHLTSFSFSWTVCHRPFQPLCQRSGRICGEGRYRGCPADSGWRNPDLSAEVFHWGRLTRLSECILL